jgi:hypothetical protein
MASKGVTWGGIVPEQAALQSVAPFSEKMAVAASKLLQCCIGQGTRKWAVTKRNIHVS